MPTFFEFFAGGGMVRAGLGSAWRCLFANDWDAKKSAAYRANWNGEELFQGDVREACKHLPAETPDLVWASFPCQDLSLAGAGKGLNGARSGTFWPFWKLIQQMRKAGRVPAAIVLENVCGALTSHDGRDFQAIAAAFADIDFDLGAVVLDAELFVPQSRPRLFIIGAPSHNGVAGARSSARSERWHPPALQRAYAGLSKDLQRRWVWWDLPSPSHRNACLADLMEPDSNVHWHSPAETGRHLAMMSPANLAKVEKAKAARRRLVGAMYRRTRKTADGASVQRAEVRFDEVAGCLRTPAGGSSRQQLIVVDGAKVRSRLMSPRETARLMGLDDSYKLPTQRNEAYHLTGDGVVVPVVKHLAENLLLHLVDAERASRGDPCGRPIPQCADEGRSQGLPLHSAPPPAAVTRRGVRPPASA